MTLKTLVVRTLLIILPACANADWQIASDPNSTLSRDLFFQTNMEELQAAQPTSSTARHSVSRTILVASPRPSAHHMVICRRKRPHNIRASHDVIIQQPVDFSRLPAFYTINMKGSVKQNLERIMGRYHWKVIWKSPYDYNFDGRIVGTNLPNAIEKLLEPFPLQGVMYVANHTLTIVQRVKL